MMKNILFAVISLVSISAVAGQVHAVSADDAQRALSQGAFAVDVREAGLIARGHLSGAAALPSDIAKRSVTELAERLSQAGVDSSRTILVVGEAGDENAQSLAELLSKVTAGRVLWLVGGVTEWQMRGYALVTESAPRAAVPQVLTHYAVEPREPRMAGSRVRSGALLERDLGFKMARATP
jgi:rhodanese-related sulfurtransferase